MDDVHSLDMVDRPFTKISIRLYEADQDLHLAIRKALSGPHLEASDTDTARFIYERGLASAAQELGLKRSSVAPKKGSK